MKTVILSFLLLVAAAHVSGQPRSTNVLHRYVDNGYEGDVDLKHLSRDRHKKLTVIRVTPQGQTNDTTMVLEYMLNDKGQLIREVKISPLYDSVRHIISHTYDKVGNQIETRTRVVRGKEIHVTKRVFDQRKMLASYKKYDLQYGDETTPYEERIVAHVFKEEPDKYIQGRLDTKPDDKEVGTEEFYHYDKKKRLERQIFFEKTPFRNKKTTSLFRYDKYDQLTTEIIDGTPKHYTYANEMHVLHVTTNIQYPDSLIAERSTFEYDRIIVRETHHNGQLIKKLLWSYNDHGQVIKRAEFDYLVEIDGKLEFDPNVRAVYYLYYYE